MVVSSDQANMRVIRVIRCIVLPHHFVLRDRLLSSVLLLSGFVLGVRVLCLGPQFLSHILRNEQRLISHYPSSTTTLLPYWGP